MNLERVKKVKTNLEKNRMKRGLGVRIADNLHVGVMRGLVDWGKSPTKDKKYTSIRYFPCICCVNFTITASED
jgi:hypothetical protein